MSIKRVREGPGKPEWEDDFKGFDAGNAYAIWDVTVETGNAYITSRNTITLEDYR